MREKIEAHEALDFCSDAEVCNLDEVRELESDYAKLEARLVEAVEVIDCLLEDMCFVCRIHNPQHKDCTSCEERDMYLEKRKTLDQEKGKNDGNR